MSETPRGRSGPKRLPARDGAAKGADPGAVNGSSRSAAKGLAGWASPRRSPGARQPGLTGGCWRCRPGVSRSRQARPAPGEATGEGAVRAGVGARGGAGSCGGRFRAKSRRGGAGAQAPEAQAFPRNGRSRAEAACFRFGGDSQAPPAHSGTGGVPSAPARAKARARRHLCAHSLQAGNDSDAGIQRQGTSLASGD